MATAWKFEYDPGTGTETIEFDLIECAQRRSVQNANVDVQTTKNRRSRIYVGPHIWDSIELTFFVENSDVITKLEELIAVRVDLTFYYRFHVNALLTKTVRVLPKLQKEYQAGFLIASQPTITLIETS